MGLILQDAVASKVEHERKQNVEAPPTFQLMIQDYNALAATVKRLKTHSKHKILLIKYNKGHLKGNSSFDGEQ